MFSTIRSALLNLICGGLALALLSGTAMAGPKAYVGNFGDSTVSAIDTASGKVVATIPVAAGPHGMAISADGKTVYVSGDGSSSLSIIDTATDKVTKTVEVGKAPNGVTLTPNGKLLLVAIYAEDRIALLDTAKQAIVGSIPVAKPHTVSISPNGKVAYVTVQDPGHFGLAVVDILKRAVVKTIPLEKTPRDAELSADGKRFYFTEAGVSAVEVLDPAFDKIIAEIPTGVSPHFVKRFKGMKLGVVVVQGPGELMLFDPGTNKPVRNISVGKQPHWATVSSDGKTAFVTNEGSNDLTVIDIASGKTSTIAVGKAPRKVVVQPAGQQHAETMSMPQAIAMSNEHTASAGQQTAQAAGGGAVSIAGFAFNPGSITVHPGDSLTWTNNDGSPHTVTFNDGSTSSQSLLPGQSFTRTFDKVGSYDYHCSFHPYMTAKVVVAGNS